MRYSDHTKRMPYFEKKKKRKMFSEGRVIMKRGLESGVRKQWGCTVVTYGQRLLDFPMEDDFDLLGPVSRAELVVDTG